MSQALDQACANGHAVVASYLIECGVNVNTIVREPIQFLRLNDYDYIYRYIEKDAENELWPRTALQACLQATPRYDRIQGILTDIVEKFKDRKQNFLSKQQAVVELLLRENANIDVVDSRGRSALHYAALYCSANTVRTLLLCGAAIDVLDNDNRTPFFYAAWRELDSFKVLKVLTEAEEQATKPLAPHTSSALLLDAALSVFNQGFVESDSVHQVLDTGPGAVIRYLLQSQHDIQATATGLTLLLQMAAADGDSELVTLLIERGVDAKAVDHYFGTALHAAARFGHLDCVKLLVEAGGDIASMAGAKRWTPLRNAVEGRHLATVQGLLDMGAMQSYNCSIDRGFPTDSTLSSACRSGSIDLVKMLLLYSEPNTLMPGQTRIRRAQFVDTTSALQGACENGHAEIAALLIEYADLSTIKPINLSTLD